MGTSRCGVTPSTCGTAAAASAAVESDPASSVAAAARDAVTDASVCRNADALPACNAAGAACADG